MVVLLFIIGYLVIIFGNAISINKIIPSILMATICWSLIIYFNIPVYEIKHELIQINSKILLFNNLGKTSEVIFFLIGAMSIISMMEKLYAFEALKKIFYTNTKKKFLWKLNLISFLLSAVIDNLTATIVIISLLKKTVPKYKERLYYISSAVISANAGGVWSPIGDITTTMLWISQKVTTFSLFKKILIPSVICMFISTFFISHFSVFKGKIKIKKNDNISKENMRIGFSVLIIGLILILMVPIYKIILGIPPYMGIILSLGLFLLFISINYQKNNNKINNYIEEIFKKLDISSILFFFGILLSVSSLESIGVLYKFSYWINSNVSTWKITTFIFGFISSIIDNIPLIAGTISMFPFYKIDHNLWHFMAYTSGTGGSLFLIGSASGVAAMSIEKIDFLWYLKKISWIALIGYFFGFIYLLFYSYYSFF